MSAIQGLSSVGEMFNRNIDFDVDTLMNYIFSIQKDNLKNQVLMALINLLCASTISDLILSGGKTALKFEVITRYPEELGKELMETLNHAVTLVPAEGMYSGNKSSILFCVISKRELTEFKRVLAKYPDTFSYRSTVNEVYGKFRKHKDDVCP